MTPSSKLAAAAVAVLFVLAPTAFAESPGAPGPGATRGIERTEGAAVGARSRAPGRVVPDREAGRDVPGQTFAPRSDRSRSDGANVAPEGRSSPAPGQSPATGDASGGDRRTEGPAMRPRAWASDPDFRAAFGEAHSVGVADLRRVNDAGAGDPQPPARRVPGASTPPRQD